MNALAKNFLLTIIVFLISSNIWAANKAAEYEYPELMVVPSASNRLKELAKREGRRGIMANWHRQMSAMTTLVAGALMMGDVDPIEDEDENSPKFGLIIGASWLGANWYLGNKKPIYARGYNRIKKMPTKTARQRLARERYAEEVLNDYGSFDKQLNWISMGTNFVANIFMLTSAIDDSKGKLFSILGAIASITPMIFEGDWERNKRIHEEYKRKVYSPIVGMNLMKVPGHNKLTMGPSLLFRW